MLNFGTYEGAATCSLMYKSLPNFQKGKGKLFQMFKMTQWLQIGTMQLDWTVRRLIVFSRVHPFVCQQCVTYNDEDSGDTKKNYSYLCYVIC
jgi:hypothetical protein